MGIYNMVNSTCQKAACCYYKKDTKNLVNFHNRNFPRQIKIGQAPVSSIAFHFHQRHFVRHRSSSYCFSNHVPKQEVSQSQIRVMAYLG